MSLKLNFFLHFLLGYIIEALIWWKFHGEWAIGSWEIAFWVIEITMKNKEINLLCLAISLNYICKFQLNLLDCITFMTYWQKIYLPIWNTLQLGKCEISCTTIRKFIPWLSPKLSIKVMLQEVTKYQAFLSINSKITLGLSISMNVNHPGIIK